MAIPFSAAPAPTPRTDAEEVYYSEIVTGRDAGLYWVRSDFARQLERENADLRHDLERAMANHNADINSSAGPGERDKNAAPQASPSVAPAVHAGPAVAAPLELSEDQLWTMVRVYHGFKTEAAMVEVVGYSMELHVAKMKEAVNALSLSPATGEGHK